MPSVFAKVEKQNSVESQDPLKQVQNLVEKKIRNLEKRKGKLEQLKEEQQTGKALHDDQKKAIKRFDEVIEMLDFFKEFNKNVSSIFAEHAKLVKKSLKKEQLERQQQEAERLKTVLLFQDLLNSFGVEETKNDFRKGTNGAIVLTDAQLEQLDELYKQLQPDRSHAEESFDKQLENAGDRWISLVEGKNREAIKGTTYKDLKELLTSISVCSYFDKSTKSEIKPETIGEGGDVTAALVEKPLEVSLTEFVSSSRLNNELEQESDTCHAVSGAKTKGGTMNSLLGQSADNLGYKFLQESQISMDPAVIYCHTSNPMGIQNAEVLASQMAGIPMTTTTSSTQKQPTTYDPINSHQPIPTQTFTNQNFAAMMGVTPTFVPASSMAIGLPVQPVPQHISVQSISPHHTTPSPDMITVQDPNQQLMQQHITNYQDSNFTTYQVESRNDTSQENAAPEDNGGYGQNQQHGQYRSNYGRGGNRGGRGGGNRGASMNGHPRGNRSQTGGRGVYSSSFANNSSNYNSNNTYYSDNKRGLSNPAGKGTQVNRSAGGRSAGGAGTNRNVAAANFSNNK